MCLPATGIGAENAATLHFSRTSLVRHDKDCVEGMETQLDLRIFIIEAARARESGGSTFKKKKKKPTG
jgi:hypothetical protein